jgi:hypothetical protein
MGWGADMTRLPESAGGGSNGTPEQQAIWRGVKTQRLKELGVTTTKKRRTKASSARAAKADAPAKPSKRPTTKKAAKSRRAK